MASSRLSLTEYGYRNGKRVRWVQEEAESLRTGVVILPFVLSLSKGGRPRPNAELFMVRQAHHEREGKLTGNVGDICKTQTRPEDVSSLPDGKRSRVREIDRCVRFQSGETPSEKRRQIGCTVFPLGSRVRGNDGAFCKGHT